MLNIEKRNNVKSALIKLGVVLAGLIGLSSFASASSFFWRTEEGTLINLSEGEIKKRLVAGENVVAGDVCYLKASDGKFWKAKGDAESTCKNLIVLALASISANATGVFLVKGNYTSSSLTIGEYYVSVSTAGAMVSTRPSTSTNIVRVIGNATSATNLFFDPDKTYVQVA